MFPIDFMKHLFVTLMAVAAGVRSLSACDLCAVYAANEARGDTGKGWFGGVAEQFTHFATLQEDGTEVPNDAHQWLDSSISQLFAGYNVTPRWGVQFNVPLIYRSFERPEGFATDRGTESGLGDVLLLGHVQLLRRESVDGSFVWNALGGVKMPTGSSTRIAEELDETEVPGAPESGIHGHDLTLGSGSWDGVVGTSLFARWRLAIFRGALQYNLRTRGDYDYRFADDLTWSGGPGALLLLHDNYSLSLLANVSGEHKGTDDLNGETAADTGIDSVFVGPELAFTWQDRLSAELGVDVPVSIDNTALQLVPDYRLRAALTWHF